MTHRFHFTNNARWFAVNAPSHKPCSERGWLYQTIAEAPGIMTETLQEQWVYQASLSSRLKELADAGYIRSEKIADLFPEENQ